MSHATKKREGERAGRLAPSSPNWPVIAAGAALVLAGVAAYHNSLNGPFIFDDLPSIVENTSIRRLWPLSEVLGNNQQDSGITSGGRPLMNLSLALNYAFGHLDVRGYHVANLLIHLLAGLTLFGVTRRTLRQPVLANRFSAMALGLGFAVAALWTLHPLQTESVTYIAQRAEALMGLFYLLTIYCFIRGAEAEPAPQPQTASPRREQTPTGGTGWFALAFVACLSGMASKEVMVSAPVMVFLYDRTFVAGSFREAWRRRWPVHLALAASWLLLFWLMAGTESRGGTVGFNTEVSSWHYLLTQCRAVVTYLRLALWPHPLVFDYGEAVVVSPTEVWPQALLLLALATATVVALWRRPVWGFLGFWFFAILAPSSSFVPLPHQTLAEHRMYLSLAAVVAAGVAGLHALAGRRATAVCLVLAAGLAAATVGRNLDYRSELTLWTVTVAQQPDNSRAHIQLAAAYGESSQWADATAQYEQALQLRPNSAEALTGLGTVEAANDRAPEAIAHFERALQLKPGMAEAHLNLGNLLTTEGRWAEAIVHLERALQIRPGLALAERSLGYALDKAGRTEEAIPHFAQAVRLDPGFAEAEFSWALALANTNRFAEAVPHFDRAVGRVEHPAAAHNSYGHALMQAGRLDEAIRQYEISLRLDPSQAETHLNLAVALHQAGRKQEAEPHLREALRLNPQLVPGN